MRRIVRPTECLGSALCASPSESIREPNTRRSHFLASRRVPLSYVPEVEAQRFATGTLNQIGRSGPPMVHVHGAQPLRISSIGGGHRSRFVTTGLSRFVRTDCGCLDWGRWSLVAVIARMDPPWLRVNEPGTVRRSNLLCCQRSIVQAGFLDFPCQISEPGTL